MKRKTETSNNSNDGDHVSGSGRGDSGMKKKYDKNNKNLGNEQKNEQNTNSADKRKKKKIYKDTDPDGTHDVAYSTFETNPKEKLKDDLKRLVKNTTAATGSEQKQVQQKIQQHLYGTSSIDLLQVRQAAIQTYERNESQMNDWNKIITSFDSTPKQRSLALRKIKPNAHLQHQIQHHENKRYKASINAVYAEQLLQPSAASNNYGTIQVENDMERTTRLNQIQLKQQLQQSQQSTDDSTNNNNNNPARHIYNIQLNEALGPYGMKYDRSGRYSCLYSNGKGGGGVGHVAIMDAAEQILQTEFHLPNDRIRDATFLHNSTMFALAQKQYVYIYDNTGSEIHCCTSHVDPMAIQFLPYHYLLVSIGRAGYLKYQDTSTGQVVSQHRTQLGPCSVLQQNKSNAIIHCGHTNGTVTLWSPNQSKYLVKILCHKGGAGITAMAIDQSGRNMVTAGVDKQIKIWDLRMTFQYCHSYYTQSSKTPTCLDISQRNMLAIGHGGHVTVWDSQAIQTKVKSPYMEHVVNTLGGAAPVNTIQFRPYEDICGIGHATGISSIVIPGSGEAALDTYEYNTNPYQDTKQRREAEVRSLLDKLQPSMISLDTQQIGTVEVPDLYSKFEQIQKNRVISTSKSPNQSSSTKITKENDNNDDSDSNDDDAQGTGTNKKKKRRSIGKRRGKSKVQGQIRHHQQSYQSNVDEKVVHTHEYNKLLQEVFQEESKQHQSTSVVGKNKSRTEGSDDDNDDDDNNNNTGSGKKERRRRRRRKSKNQSNEGDANQNYDSDDSNTNNNRSTSNRDSDNNNSVDTKTKSTTISKTNQSTSTISLSAPSALKRFFS